MSIKKYLVIFLTKKCQNESLVKCVVTLHITPHSTVVAKRLKRWYWWRTGSSVNKQSADEGYSIRQQLIIAMENFILPIGSWYSINKWRELTLDPQGKSLPSRNWSSQNWGSLGKTMRTGLVHRPLEEQFGPAQERWHKLALWHGDLQRTSSSLSKKTQIL